MQYAICSVRTSYAVDILYTLINPRVSCRASLVCWNHKT